jgi:general secretion pathway protein L
LSGYVAGLAEAGHRIEAALAWWAAELGGVVGAEGRPAPARSDLALHLGPPGADQALVLIDRRGAPPRRYTLAAGGDDLSERLAAIRGTGRKAVSVAVLVDPAACFLRSLHLPAAALPRMREVLAQELEAATPFRVAGIHADWFVEGEDETGLRVRHVVLKRARLDPILAVLARAGLQVEAVGVGTSEDRALPVDLLSGGRRPIPRLLRGLTWGDGAALALAGLLALAAFGLWRAHQEATLGALETATFAARRAAPPRLAPPVQALAGALAAERAARPPLALLWSALAAALPAGAFAEALHLGPEGATATLRTSDLDATLRALRTAPGLGPVAVREQDAATGRLVVGLLTRPWTDPAGGPTRLRP